MLTDAIILSKLLRTNGYKDRLVPHGFRSMARTWMAENGIDRDVAEVRLAHVDSNEVVRIYQRSDFLEKRRLDMTLWSEYVRKCLICNNRKKIRF